MLKKNLIIFVIMGVFFSTSAQYTNVYTTARVDALAGTALINDLTYSTFNPGKIFSFADQINMTGYTAGWIAGQWGPLFANKSIGEHVVIGFNMCTDFYLSDPFYKRAAVNSNNAEHLATGFPWMPKLSLAMKFGENVFGIGGFVDYSHHELVRETTDKPNLGGVDTIQWTENTEERDNLIMSPGVTFSAVIKLGPVYIEPLCGISFADANLEKNTTDITENYVFDSLTFASTNDSSSSYKPGATTTVKKLETLKDKAAWKDKPRSFYNLGACMFGDIGKVWWILGNWYKNEEFQFHRTITVNGVAEPEHLYKNCRYQNSSWLAGIVPKIAENLLLGIQYDGGWTKSERIIDRSDPENLDASETFKDTTLVDWSHSLRFIIEREFNGKRFLDKIIPRGGLKWNISRGYQETYWEKHVNGSIVTEYEEQHFNMISTKVNLTGGLAIIKGPVQFDLCFDVLNYDTGVLIGPGMYSLSIILNFAKIKLK